jgi:hypothetical protein
MKTLGLCLIIELCLAFGFSGLFWPTKLMPIFKVLIFPWPATGRAVRTNCFAALGVAALLFVTLLTSPH